MKFKLFILALFTVVTVSSCRKQQCPAYGKVAPKATKIQSYKV